MGLCACSSCSMWPHSDTLTQQAPSTVLVQLLRALPMLASAAAWTIQCRGQPFQLHVG